MTATAIPLALYIHYPWCIKKCPYCDFNSHTRAGQAADLDRAYVDALLIDLAVQYAEQPRPIQSIFIGGGTPSLLAGTEIARLLEAIDAIADLDAGAEITLEANPGAVDAARFVEYRKAGVNRLSIGIQSLDNQRLAAIGRVHDRKAALQAVELACKAGFDNLNLDFMFGLPGQTLAGALQDLREAMALQPEHLSWYQLGLEPHTPFYQSPPELPDDDSIAQMQEAGFALLASAGYRQYEVSAHARPGHECRHNLNYWQFGDYLGIGAGAHGKRTLATAEVVRLAKARRPEAYIQTPLAFSSKTQLEPGELVLEFMLNALRLRQGVRLSLFEERTGLGQAALEPGLAKARDLGLLEANQEILKATDFGFRFLNDLLGCFMPD